MSGGRDRLPAVIDTTPTFTVPALRSTLAVPAMIPEAGDHAAKRFLDFFAASIENDNTRLAYYRAVASFFAWLEQHGICELPDIEPFHVAAYLKALRVSDARPHVRLRAGRPVSQYAGSEGCAGQAGAEPHAEETGHGGLYHVCRT